MFGQNFGKIFFFCLLSSFIKITYSIFLTVFIYFFIFLRVDILLVSFFKLRFCEWLESLNQNSIFLSFLFFWSCLLKQIFKEGSQKIRTDSKK